MRLLLFLLLCPFGFLATGQGITGKPITNLTKDSIHSSLDNNTQSFYYYKSTDTKPRPLLVQLHSWSFPADSLKTIGLDVEAAERNINYLFPNFRGVNNHPKACCSNFVISDIDEAIDWALKNLNVDKAQIYVVGVSGGGYATLAMYMKSRHNIKAFSAWVPITDLVSWYGQSIERQNKYAAEIIACTGGTEVFDSAKARERSPIFWKTPVNKRKHSVVQIFAGIHDGYTGPVPISHSVNFYNKLLSDHGISDSAMYVPRKDLETMLRQQAFGVNSRLTIGDKAIHYQKKSKSFMLTIFEGGHEMRSHEVLGYIDQINGSH